MEWNEVRNCFLCCRVVADRATPCFHESIFDYCMTYTLSCRNMRLGLARTPLHRLTDDIPRPEFMADIWNEVVGVSMSMGHSHSLHRNHSKVRLTSDALDYFIFNVKGETERVVVGVGMRTACG